MTSACSTAMVWTASRRCGCAVGYYCAELENGRETSIMLACNFSITLSERATIMHTGIRLPVILLHIEHKENVIELSNGRSVSHSLITYADCAEGCSALFVAVIEQRLA